MNVYKRPLFMQQGGAPRMPVPTPPAAMRPATAPSGAMPPMRPASAPMGAPGAPPRPPAQDVAGIASMVSQKGQMELDQAQGPEQIINAFRGNQKPLEARYQELAQYVGPQDATATPLSVLTMVQPSLMMTAQGASESGIGELMANVASGVDMESAPGQPNRMGQGLGNLMMSNQAPQPAGMAQGGVVGKFAKGGSALKDYYNEDLATFQEIMAPTQQDRDASKRQLFFDIAQRGLAMAGGAGGTGNVASQLANVFQTLPQTYSAQQAELRKGEQGARNAALQSAAGRVQGDREQTAKIAAKQAEMAEEFRLKGLEMNQEFIYDMTVENAKARNKGLEFEGVIAVDSNGKPISDGGIFNMKDPADVRRMQQFQAGRQDVTFSELPKFSDLSSSGTAPDIKRVRKSDGSVETFNLSNPAQAAAYTTAMQAGGQKVDVEVPDMFTDSVLLDKLISGKLTSQELTSLNAAIADKTSFKTRVTNRVNPDGSQAIESIPGERLPDQWNAAIQQARQGGLDIQLPPYLSSGQASGGAQPLTENSLSTSYEQQVQSGQPLTAAELGALPLPDLGNQASGIETAVMEYPIDNLFGTWASLDRTWNTVAPSVLGIMGQEMGESAAPTQIEANAENGLNAFHTLVVESMLAARPGRASNESRQVLTNLLPTINSAFTNKADALGKYSALRGEMRTDLNRVTEYLNQGLSQPDRQKYDFIRRELGDRLSELDTIVTQLEKATPGGQGTPASAFDDVFSKNTKVPYATN